MIEQPIIHDPAALGKRIRTMRGVANMSQGALARALGWHRPTISEIEAGRRKVKAEELPLIAAALHIRQEDLLDKNFDAWDAQEKARITVFDESVRTPLGELAKTLMALGYMMEFPQEVSLEMRVETGQLLQRQGQWLLKALYPVSDEDDET